MARTTIYVIGAVAILVAAHCYFSIPQKPPLTPAENKLNSPAASAYYGGDAIRYAWKQTQSYVLKK